MAVQYGDVAVANNPFGALDEVGEVELVDDSGSAIAAACTKDGAYGGVVELLLEGEGSDVVRTGKLVVGVEKVLGKHDIELPGTKEADSRFDFARGYLTGRGDDGNAVARLEVGRVYHTGMITEVEDGYCVKKLGSFYILTFNSIFFCIFATSIHL